TVLDVPPTIALTGNDSVLVGQPYTLNLGAVTDPGADTVTGYFVHWGDGVTEFFDVNPTGNMRQHTYVSAAVRTISVDLVDDDGIHLAAGSKTITVRPAPTIDLSGAASVNEGSPYTLAFGAIHNAAPGGITQILVNWGDGTPPDSFVPGQPS